MYRINPLLLFCALLYTACTQPSEQSNSEQVANAMVMQDVHSYAKPAEAVVRHLNWQAKVNFDSLTIDAVAHLHIDASQNAEQLILDTKELIIKKVTLGKGQETETQFSLGATDQNLGQALKINIKPTTRQVNIYYATSPGAEALQWLRPEQTAGKKQPFLFTQSQAILARSWVPIQDSPGIRFTYEATVKVPKNLLALMSAENPQKRNERGEYSFRMEQPIPAYLLALAVGDLEFEALGTNTGIYAEPSQLKKATYEFAELDDMLAAAEKLYGPYSWQRYDLLVLPPSFPFGGMENPRLTFVTPTILAGDRSLTSLVAHELAHSWSGNLVTNATWNDFWLNEGFTVYFERRIMEEISGQDYAEMLALLGQQDLEATVADLTADSMAADTRLHLDLTNRNPDDGVTDIAYEKGYSFLRYLESKVGRKKWDAFLTRYFQVNAFQSMTTTGFIEYLTTNLLTPNGLTPEDVHLSAWIYNEGLPEQLIKVSSSRFKQVDATLLAWQSGKAAASLPTANWSSHEWLHFIRHLPANITVEQMTGLDTAFGFTQSGNSEVVAAWFEHVIGHKYQAAYPALRNFLLSVGRRKFLVPIYKALSQSPEGKTFALDVYHQARPNYHAVSTNTLDKLLNYTPD